MATYYCDLAEGTFADRSGADSGANVLTGPAGLQAAIRGTGNATSLAAGDTIYCAGTGDMTRLVELDLNGYDATAGGNGWNIGDAVESKDGGSAQWSGVIVETNDGGFLGASDIILVWLASGKSASDIVVADGITNTTQTESQDPISSADQASIELDAEGSQASGYIKFIGVETSGFTNDGTRCALTSGDTNHNGFVNTGDDMIWLENWEFSGFSNSTGYGAYKFDLSPSYRCAFINCYFHDNYRALRNENYASYCLYFRCHWKNNTYTFAIYDPGAESVIDSCIFEDMTTGVRINDHGKCLLINSLFVGCTTGIQSGDDCDIRDCTFVGNMTTAAGIGIDWEYNNSCFIHNCRFAGLTTALNVDAGCRALLFNCYFDDSNTTDISGDYENISNDGVSSVTLAGTDTDAGFEDASADNYNLASDATRRSIAIEMNV